MNRNQNRTKYTAKINRAIDFIDANLDQELTLDQVARYSGFSEFHFHRIFSSLVGETFGRFVQRVRIERSAILLLNDNARTITDVAFSCGFSSSSSYSRLFKEFFSCTPSQWRDAKIRDSKIRTVLCKDYHVHSTPRQDIVVSSSYNRERNGFEWKIALEGEDLATVRVESYGERELAYIRHIGPYMADEALFCSLFEQLFKWAVPRKLVNERTQNFSIYHDDPSITDEEKLRLSVAIDVPPDTDVSGEVGRMVLPAGEYAVARFHLGPDRYGIAWRIVYSDWLPESGYMCAEGLPYESLLNDPLKDPEGKHLFEIAIPVVPL